MKLRTIYLAVLPSLVLLPLLAVAQQESVGDYTISLRAGWNSIAFFEPPKATDDFPQEIDWLVVLRSGKFHVADLKGGQPPLDTANLLPDEVKSSFRGKEDLDVASLVPNEGCLVFCSEPTEIALVVPDLDSLSLPTLTVDTWHFLSFPIGGYGNISSSPESGFAQPNEAPFYSFLAITKGNEPDVTYLSTVPAPRDNPNDLSGTWKSLRPTPDPNASWREEWRLRQNEAIWIRVKEDVAVPELTATAIEDVKIELERHHDEEGPPPWQDELSKSVLLSLGTSLSYIDVKVAVEQSSSPVLYHLHEVDWYKADVDWYERGDDGRPTKKKLLAALRAAGKDLSNAPGEGFVLIDSEARQPKISVSHKYAVVPYLDSSHGPWSYNRSIRINTERKTKGDLDGENIKSRILEPGVYLGRLRLVSSASNNAALPNIVILLEVPELYGGYEGTIAAQVLSIRGDEILTPRKFFAQATERPEGEAIPFAELLNAARPGARSIQIGTFPIRLRILPQGDTKVASILRDGSFLVSKDLRLGVLYDFIPVHSGFHAIDVELDSAKKTLLLTSTSLRDVSPHLVPILGTPVEKHELDVPKDDPIQIRRDIQALLQEDASGYLHGVYIERLGRSKGEDSAGTIVRRMEKNLATGKVANFEQELYVIGEINLFRSTSKDEEERVVKQENPE